jgi:hypothetical protein
MYSWIAACLLSSAAARAFFAANTAQSSTLITTSVFDGYGVRTVSIFAPSSFVHDTISKSSWKPWAWPAGVTFTVSRSFAFSPSSASTAASMRPTRVASLTGCAA